jgi:hypothetical protein
MITPVSQVNSIHTSNDGSFIEAELQIGPTNHSIYFRSNDISLTGNMEAFLALALLPSMMKGGALVADGEVSQRFLDALPTILDIFCVWEPSLHRVKVNNVTPVIRDCPKEHRVGAFFSGGVDSFYTFLKHRDEITDLIFVNGFDISLEDDSLRRRTSELIRRIGSSFGKRVIEVETNHRLFLMSYLRRHWVRLAHGVGLVSVGHLLSPFFKRIYVPGTHTYAHLMPLGSHPILDPLWSTETLEFVHDGCEANRIDKIALLSQFDIALQCLRVCFFPRSKGAYNCGQCEKCLRTMINLHAVGALDRCTAFNTRLKIKEISRLIVSDESTHLFAMENLRALENREGDRKLYRTLLKISNRPPWRARIIKKSRHIKGRLNNSASKFLLLYGKLFHH